MNGTNLHCVAWNVAHQTREKAISRRLTDCLLALDADLITLNEFVDGTTRRPFLSELRNAGYDVRVSKRHHDHNQVLVASRYSLDDGHIKGPGSSLLDHSNFLHVTVQAAGLDFFGVRVPCYDLAADKNRYWNDFLELAATLRGRRALFAGDLNADPRRKRAAGSRQLNMLRSSGWDVPEPEGPWSFWRRGNWSRVDHVVADPSVGVTNVRYLSQCSAGNLAGADDAASDHAVLAFDIPVTAPTT